MYCKKCGKKMADNVCSCKKCGWVDVSKMPRYPGYTLGVQQPPKSKNGEKIIQMYPYVGNGTVYTPQEEPKKESNKSMKICFYLSIILSLCGTLLASYVHITYSYVQFYILTCRIAPIILGCVAFAKGRSLEGDSALKILSTLNFVYCIIQGISFLPSLFPEIFGL